MRFLTVAAASLLVHQHHLPPLFLGRIASTSIRSVQAFSPAAFASRQRHHPRHPFHSTNTRSSSSTSTSALNMTKRVLVPIADGSEEIETTCITDTLTRFGAQVTIASVMPTTSTTNNGLLCTMSRGIKVMADMSIDDAAKKVEQEPYDLVVCPGGMPGAAHLRDSKTLQTILEQQKASGRPYAAICAAPAVVLATHNMLDAKATCYPAPQFRATLTDPVDDAVAVTGGGQITTSKGPGTALLFALELGEQLYGKEARDKIQKEMLV